uniref:Cyclic nucleotide-binding domain-containing protein n=1 Tax=Neogobius melanostomus TaxID=47308 RepID=A0A8C6WV42_9GOBI
MGTLRDLQFALQLKIEELRQRDTLIDELELELDTKDELIRRLQEELDRYRATFSLPGTSTGWTFEQWSSNYGAFSHKSFEKTPESQRLISAAFQKSDLLKHLDDREIKAILPCMYPAAINQGCYVFKEETIGTQAYVVEEGRLDVKKDGLKLHTVLPEEVFGELALLYNCTHNYSVSGAIRGWCYVIWAA